MQTPEDFGSEDFNNHLFYDNATAAAAAAAAAAADQQQDWKNTGKTKKNTRLYSNNRFAPFLTRSEWAGDGKLVMER